MEVSQVSKVCKTYFQICYNAIHYRNYSVNTCVRMIRLPRGNDAISNNNPLPKVLASKRQQAQQLCRENMYFSGRKQFTKLDHIRERLGIVQWVNFPGQTPFSTVFELCSKPSRCQGRGKGPGWPWGHVILDNEHFTQYGKHGTLLPIHYALYTIKWLLTHFWYMRI